MRRLLSVVLLACAAPAASMTARSARPAPVSVPSLRAGLGVVTAAPSLTAPSLSGLSLSAPSIAAAPSPLSAPSAFSAPAAVPAAAVAAPEAAVFAAPAESPSADPKSLAVQAVVDREVAAWEVRSAPADAPSAGAPRPAGRPGLAKAALWTGVGALGLSALGSVPGVAPDLLVAAKGWLAAGGFTALTASRFLGPAADKAAAVPAPPAPAEGRFAAYRTGWRGVEHALDVQKTFEKRVGDGERSAFTAWLGGGLRAGYYASGAALLSMLAGGAVAKAYSLASTAFTAAVQTAPAAPAGTAAVAAAPFWGQFGAFVAPALVLETVLLKGVFDGGRAVLGKVLAPRAAAVVAGGLAVAGSVAAMSLLTTELSVLLPIAGLEAAVVWAYARSGSLLAALAARALITLLALESARVGAWLAYGTAGTLAGLPAWTGVAVAGLLVLGYLFVAKDLGWSAALRAPGRALGALGDWWRAPAADGRPKGVFPVLKSGLLWGLVTYAVGDLAYRAVQLLEGASGAEAAPGILVKVLTGPLDLLLFNFVIVGFLEEFVFRRNLFKPMREWIEKRGLSPRAVFWTAALGSSLIFSYVHYIDFAGLLAKIGIGLGGAAGVAGSYDWAWASFIARAASGVVLAYQYWRSGLLLVPIVAHFAANTMEGLGLRWGPEAFLLMAAGALLLQLLGRSPKAASQPRI